MDHSTLTVILVFWGIPSTSIQTSPRSERHSVRHVTLLLDYVNRLRFSHCRLLSVPLSLVMALTLILCSFALALLPCGKSAASEAPNSSDLCTCNDIAAAISGESQVFFPRMSLSHLLHFILMPDQAAPEYLLDIFQASSSSSQASACSVEPGSPEDVSKIVRYLHLTNQLFPTYISLAAYSRNKSNSLCCERWRTRNEPGIFLH